MHNAVLPAQLSRDVYRPTSLQGLEAADLVAVAARVPNGILCLNFRARICMS
jgi:hypothetical protein